MKIFRIKKEKNGKSFYFFEKKLLRIGGYSKTSIIKKIDSLDSFLKNFFIASHLASASGLLRDIQLAQLKMLEEVHRICEKNKLTYWLEFGTLIGAVRHKGFIPWDDDIDICMMRSDYERFISIFNEQTVDKNLYAAQRSCGKGLYNSINIYHSQIKLITIDIFPCDFYYKQLDDNEKIEFSIKLQKLCENNKKYYTSLNISEFHNHIKKLQNTYFPETNDSRDFKTPSIFFGIEFCHKAHPFNIFDYNTIFPLKKIQFEGKEFYSVNNPDIHLTYLYGDYMSLPKNISYHHDISKLPIPDLVTLKKFIHGEK